MWTPIKPKFTEECILLTATKYPEGWSYNSWLVIGSGNDSWYLDLYTIDGREWGGIDDLSAHLYQVVDIPKI
jgi:hypothetical protein